ncbi:MAG: hypothetical protein AAGL90_07685 [Pseudomonadota bacterium]
MAQQVCDYVVLGGSGLVGRYILDKLAQTDARGVVVSRIRPNLPSGFEWVQTSDLLSGAYQLPAANCILSTWPIWLLGDTIDKFKGARQLIGLSTASVISKRDSADRTERDFATRIAQSEARVQTAARASGMTYTLYRPTIIYDGAADQSISLIAKIIRRFGFFAVAGRGRGLRQPVHAGDVAEAVLRSVDHPGVANQTFFVTGGETLDYRAFVRRIAESQGMPPRIIAVPGFVLRWAVHLMRHLGWTTVSPSLVDRMNEDLAFDGSEVVERLGFHPRGFSPRPDLTH